jgi:tetratricopeptide (TPR) repeat protein
MSNKDNPNKGELTISKHRSLEIQSNLVKRGLELASATVHAQGIEWKNLNDEARSLYQKGQLAWRKMYLAPHPRRPLNAEAVSLYINDQYERAVLVAKKAIVAAEKEVGPNHPNVAECMDTLAFIYMAQGRYAEAESLYKRSLGMWEKVRGPDHPEIGYALNNLALSYFEQERYAEAEPLYKSSLAMWEKALLSDDYDWETDIGGVDVADTVHNLAYIYWTLGRYAEVESVYKRSLAIWEKVAGQDHPSVGDALNDLANFYRTRGQYSQAEPLYKRLLAIPGYPYVDDTLNDLGVIYMDQGRYAEAEPLFKRSLVIRVKVLGPDHPEVAMSLENMAGLYRKTSRVKEAELFEKRAARIRETTAAS